MNYKPVGLEREKDQTEQYELISPFLLFSFLLERIQGQAQAEELYVTWIYATSQLYIMKVQPIPTKLWLGCQMLK